jgi:prepilin peptidase CpaA
MWLGFAAANLAASWIDWASWGAVIAACCFATVIDVRSRRIPNALTFPLLIAGVLWWTLTAGFNGLGYSIGGAAVAGLPFVVIWMMGGGGAGDAKMMLALGAWLGPANAFVATLAVALAGGVLSLAYARAHGRMLVALANTAWMFLTLPFVLLGPGGLKERQKLVPASADAPLKAPYSLAILSGACAAAVWVFTCSH